MCFFNRFVLKLIFGKEEGSRLDFKFENFSCTFKVKLNFRVILFEKTTRYNNVVGVGWR